MSKRLIFLGMVLGIGASLIPAGCAWLGADKPVDTRGMRADSIAISDHQLKLDSGPALAYRLYQPTGPALAYRLHQPTGPALGPDPTRDSTSGAAADAHLKEGRVQLPGGSDGGADNIHGGSSNGGSSHGGAARQTSPAPLIVLAHGFLRDQRNMRGLAMALAEAGYPVATLNARHDSPLSGGHAKNSQDMIALARHLKAERVIYAGFSAGALAALLAAQTDPSAAGALTLDLVDSQGLGLKAARALALPVVALAGAPTNCNANNNAAPVYRAIQNLRLTPIPEASHCDFESPSDWLCRALCQAPPGQDESTKAAVRAEIIRDAVAGIDQLAGG